MGRRKIEIKAIKDDRNRSVTFLKRKGGLFKKAHELSVLCSVDVAVFIFGSNKKLYEYSSTDMREMITRYTYHGGPNEHKGPSDFNGGNDEDEDEEGDGTPPHGESMEPQMIPPQFQGQAPFPHMRHHTPSASPPIPNGMPFPQHPGHPVQRGHTPQPGMGSRPASRQDIRRMGPNMGPQPVGPPGSQQPPVNGFAYMPNPAIYNPQNQPNMPPNMPHGIPQHGPHAIKKLPQRKQHSIFTPIDENRSILSQHLASFASDQSNGKGPQLPDQANIKIEGSRSQSVDVGAVSRTNGSTSSPPLPQRATSTSLNKTRNISVSSIPETTFTPPSRTNSMKIGGGARPRLRVEIPDEPSDGGSATAESNSPRNSTDATSQTTRRHASDSHSSGMVLPPPSPSAQTLLSAGATGPPNPFARPPPQQNNNNMNSNMNIDTPVSALPSRFLNNEFLPSPSSFYPEWYSRGGSDSNTLPSPLNFATPVVGSGPSFLRDDNATSTKRKSPEISATGPHDGPDVGNEPKRVRVDS
ncbi:hypothetical protein CGMCC3_g3023 [Colletotrichum fructicola]|nr:uncharacterized protein CGMCC3_g3023 [Colletotrichum fructicola]KAE9580913.1 hypothetical protein CGMCC3_g3023 [Colletotrichum fructicola]